MESGHVESGQVESVRFVAVGQDDPLAQPLLAELAVEYSRRYSFTEDGVAAWLRGREGTLLIGLLAGRPVTGGAFRRYDEHTAELNRIWTDSRHRQRGYAKALLAALEDRIAQCGYRRIYLTTGDRQPEAEALYQAAGYTRLEGLPDEGDIRPIAFQKMLP